MEWGCGVGVSRLRSGVVELRVWSGVVEWVWS